MIMINLNKDKNKESYVEPHIESVINCGTVSCLGNDYITCTECIFADEEGVVRTRPIISYSLRELRKLDRVKDI